MDESGAPHLEPDLFQEQSTDEAVGLLRRGDGHLWGALWSSPLRAALSICRHVEDSGR